VVRDSKVLTTTTYLIIVFFNNLFEQGQLVSRVCEVQAKLALPLGLLDRFGGLDHNVVMIFYGKRKREGGEITFNF